MPAGNPACRGHRFWSFQYVENPGAAWGLARRRERSDSGAPFFSFVSIGAMVMIVYYLFKSPPQFRMRMIALSRWCSAARLEISSTACPPALRHRLHRLALQATALPLADFQRGRRRDLGGRRIALAAARIVSCTPRPSRRSAPRRPINAPTNSDSPRPLPARLDHAQQPTPARGNGFRAATTRQRPHHEELGEARARLIVDSLERHQHARSTRQTKRERKRRAAAAFARRNDGRVHASSPAGRARRTARASPRHRR